MPPFSGYPTTRQIMSSKIYRPRVRRYRSKPIKRLSSKRRFASAVRSVVRPELKFSTLSVGPVFVAFNAPQMVRLTNIPQGNAQNQRTGNWLVPRSIYGSIVCEGNLLNADETRQIRVGVLCWKEDLHPLAADIPPIITDIMQESDSPIGPYKYTSTGKFKILTSRVYILSTNEDNSNYQKVHTFKVDLSGIDKITYDGAFGKMNQYYLFATSDEDTAANPPIITFHVSMRFNDS